MLLHERPKHSQTNHGEYYVEQTDYPGMERPSFPQHPQRRRTRSFADKPSRLHRALGSRSRKRRRWKADSAAPQRDVSDNGLQCFLQLGRLPSVRDLGAHSECPARPWAEYLLRPQPAIHQRLHIAAPPETKIVSPVIQRASSDARKETGGAMSSGCPTRPSGVAATAPLSKSLSTIPAEWVPSVMTRPGLIALTRMLRCASSLASVFVIVSTAPLVDAYTEAAAGASVLTME